MQVSSVGSGNKVNLSLSFFVAVCMYKVVKKAPTKNFTIKVELIIPRPNLMTHTTNQPKKL